MEERIQKAVQAALAATGAEDTVFVVERPTEFSHGDYTTNVAMAAFGGRRAFEKAIDGNENTVWVKYGVEITSPKKLAEVLVRLLRETLGAAVSKIEVAGPGFVNFTLSRDTVSLAIAEADAQEEGWGKGVTEADKRVMVEYTQPNPFKEMHIGHLMGNTIGESIARLVTSKGAVVMRANYQGDVGPHVAKALWGLKQAGITDPTTAAELSAAYVAGNRAYEDSPEAKPEIDALNKAVYLGSDAQLMELWRKGRDVSLAAFEEIYRILGTKFDFYFFESETAPIGLRVVQDSLAKGIFDKSDGAIVYHGEKHGLHTRVFITSQGTPTYETKDLGLAFLKEERWPSDRSIITTATEQKNYFSVILEALKEVAPLLGKKTQHVSYGFLKLTSGKMSSREGTVIPAAGFIAEIIKKAAEKNADPLIAQQVAVGAIKYMILRQSPGSDIIFDEEKSLSLEGDSGPYLQYALVRAKSVLEKASERPSSGIPSEPYFLERLITHYPEVAARAASEMTPNILVTYLTELAGEWNSFYAQERIVGGEFEAHKLLVARAFVQTMTNGLGLLGIPAPERL